MSVSRDQNTRMLTALVQLRGALQAARLPLELPGVVELRAARQQMIDQLEDYAIPRQMSVDAPLLVVVGGSTGAGKSTLVNSLVGRRVTASGLLRPTTRSPVLVHHPDEAHWFGQDRLLPDLVRVQHSTDDPHSLQLVAADTVPAGLAVLDAPDVDSVEEHNRVLAGQLLAAADLWLFVTSAARYSDQVPWQHLKQAAERSTAVALVLDRTPADAVQTVAAHLARMMASRGLKDSPLFTVNEAPVSEDGLLPPAEVADIRAWLVALAADTDAREGVVRRTLDGSVRTLARQSHTIADAVEAQLGAADELRAAADAAYDDASASLAAEATDGTLLRGEVLARWQDLVGTGELLRSLDQRVGRLRDRVVNAVKGTPQAADRVAHAIEAGAESLVLDHAESAAERVHAEWAGSDAGRALLAPGLERATEDLRRRAEAEIRGWQQEVVELVRSEASEKRASATFLAYGAQGLGTALMVLALTSSAEGRAAEAARPGRTLLDAVLGAEAVADLVERAAASLDRRMAGLLVEDRRRFHGVLAGLDLPTDSAEPLRAASRRVDDRRFEQARGGADTAIHDVNP
ncbi:dynamin family protein [Nocardioides sp. URHA0032]|uniref:dynamin family protein n=1 Tax=Nocardioides sp. URHA0032 TaxID=1380388 RepID=UPI00048D6055|nr:dynamin family protein [Nocardioides sp. URHA0032]